MRIALIDDGIEPALCPGLLPEYDLCVKEDGSVEKREGEILTDHGTTSARIILKYAPTASFCSLQVFAAGELKASIGQLLAALEWCAKERIPLIHLSLGSTLWLDYAPLRKITARLLQKGQTVVAAHSNSGAYTAPACLMGVLGVMTDGDLTEDSFYTREAGWEQVQIHASSRHMLPAWDGFFFETQVSNSYAAPLITARVHGILCGLPEKDRTAAEVYRRLAGRGSTAFRMRPDFVEDAVLFQTGEDRQQQEFFFFHVKERAGSLAALREAVGRDPYAPVVLVPSGSREVDLEACRFCWETCRLGFLYAGDAYRLGFLKAGDAPIGPDSGGPLFWDVGQYREFVARAGHMPEEGFAEDTARILVEGFTEAAAGPLAEGEGRPALTASARIQQKFREEGYLCIVISDDPYACLYGMEYLPDGVEAERFAIDVAALRQASVVVYCLGSRDGQEAPGYDFKVSVGGCRGIRMEGERIWLTELLEDVEIEALYEYTLEYEVKDGARIH